MCARDTLLSLILMFLSLSQHRSRENCDGELQRAVRGRPQVGRDVLISKLVGIILDDTFIFASNYAVEIALTFQVKPARVHRARCHWRGENANEMDLHNSNCDVTVRLFCANARPCKSPASDVRARGRGIISFLPVRPHITTSRSRVAQSAAAASNS